MPLKSLSEHIWGIDYPEIDKESLVSILHQMFGYQTSLSPDTHVISVIIGPFRSLITPERAGTRSYLLVIFGWQGLSPVLLPSSVSTNTGFAIKLRNFLLHLDSNSDWGRKPNYIKLSFNLPNESLVLITQLTIKPFFFLTFSYGTFWREKFALKIC